MSGEVTYVRTDKLEALVTAANQLAEAIVDFHTPPVLDVELVEEGINTSSYWTTDHEGVHREFPTAFKCFYTERQLKLANDPSEEGLCWMEMQGNFYSRVEPTSLMPVEITPAVAKALPWTTHEEMLALATRYEEWFLFDFTDMGGPVLGWPSDETAEGFPRGTNLRWLDLMRGGTWNYLTDEREVLHDPEYTGVMAKMYQWLRDHGAREPSEWIAEMVEANRS